MVETEDEDNPSAENSNTQPRKRQRTATYRPPRGGRPVEGTDFWSQVDLWFKVEVATRGDNLTAGGWKS